MNIHIVSDNSFFLLGIEETLVKQGDYKFKLLNIDDCADDYNKFFLPVPGDIIIVSVKNLLLRERIMQMPIIKYCRVMLMLSVPIRSMIRVYYPWLIRKDINVRELFMLINKAKKISSCLDYTSEKTKVIFKSLASGLKIEDVSSNSMLPVKHLYQVKRNIIKRYGLHHCNSIGVLICRDIIYVTNTRKV